MDNLTHTLVGAALGEAGLKRRSGLAMAALMIAANLPDIDMVAIPFGEMLTFRRGWTHGPLAIAVLPVVLTLALVDWDRFGRRRQVDTAIAIPVRPSQLLLLSAIAMFTHPLLDLLNTYGVRLLMPFSERWSYGDTLFIIDPWIWAALGAGVFLSRRRAKRALRPSTRPAQVAIALVVAYIALMAVGSRAARGAAVRHIASAEQLRPERVLASPVPVNSIRRELVYDFESHYRFGTAALLPDRRIALHPGELPTNLQHPAALAVRGEPQVRDFLYWSRYPFFVVDEDADSPFVELGDARFTRRVGGARAFTVRVNYRR